MYDLLIQDATIIREGGRRVVDIAIEGGSIAYVGDNPAGRARESISAIGRFVMPGAVDANVCLQPPERWGSLSRAAAAAGVTTLLVHSGATDRAALEALHAAAAAESIVNYGAWIRADGSNAAAAADLVAGGRACGVEVDLSVLSPEAAADCFAQRPALIGVHTEDQGSLVGSGAGVDLASHNDARPSAAAVAGIERVLAWVRETGVAAHLFQISTAAELTALELVRGELPISLEVVPDHLFLSIETAQKLQGLLKHTPPIRPELDRRGLWAAIKRGRLDTFASGHVPLIRSQKTRPWAEQPAGLPGLDALLRLLLSAVKNGRMGLEQLVEMCAENPARIFRLSGRGRIREGAAADLVLFREGEVARFAAADVRSAAGWSPFAGRELAGPPQLVVVNGRIIARDGRLLDDAPAGAAVTLGA